MNFFRKGDTFPSKVSNNKENTLNQLNSTRKTKGPVTLMSNSSYSFINKSETLMDSKFLTGKKYSKVSEWDSPF